MKVSLKTFTAFFICKFATRDRLPFKDFNREFVPDDTYTNPCLNNYMKI